MPLTLLADLLALAHLLIVLFVVLGLVLILIGGWRGWGWVRNFWFRLAHLLTIAVVAAQAALGILCPLTVWEYQLREAAAAGSGQAAPSALPPEGFIQHWVHRLLFFDWPLWVFTLLYIAFFGLVLAGFILVRPRCPRRRRRSVQDIQPSHPAKG